MTKKMVLVKWHDAKFNPGCFGEKEISELKMALFEGLGYLVSRDDVTTVMAGELNDENEFRDITLIPSGSIISIHELTPGLLV